MTALEFNGLLRTLRYVNRYHLETAVPVLLPEILEMRSLRITLGSPGGEEVKEDYFAGELGGVYRRRRRRQKFHPRQPSAWAEAGVRSPPQIGKH